MPIFEDGESWADYPKFKPPKENITAAVQGLYDWLANKPGHKDNFAYIKAANQSKSDDSNVQKSYALRFIIHYIGDIHQPLHMVEKVNKENPKGDSGGNSFDIAKKGEVSNLHSLWDSAIYLMPKNDKVVLIP